MKGKYRGSPQRREQNTKMVRAKAHTECLTFARAYGELCGDPGTSLGSWQKPRISQRTSGRNEIRWRSEGAFRIDDEDPQVRLADEDVYDTKIDFADVKKDEWDIWERRKRNVAEKIDVELMHLARPAKRRGPAKDFEVVQRVRDVIALSEDEVECSDWGDLDLEDEEWQDILDEREVTRSYSAAVRGTGG
ncbi:hypothetical protein NLJ89_g1067 [Agrocybe chaxingu]|uniref:Uncharacterized protein n=1 Tax=Agrocybe chaxingu TaxID=84603 RepID=A0A9W8N0T1_9AGAR|nr:hypothetical protein NLJ89_g1067 [Agrocybe chaxingu]